MLGLEAFSLGSSQRACHSQERASPCTEVCAFSNPFAVAKANAICHLRDLQSMSRAGAEPGRTFEKAPLLIGVQ